MPEEPKPPPPWTVHEHPEACNRMSQTCQTSLVFLSRPREGSTETENTTGLCTRAYCSTREDKGKARGSWLGTFGTATGSSPSVSSVFVPLFVCSQAPGEFYYLNEARKTCQQMQYHGIEQHALSLCSLPQDTGETCWDLPDGVVT